MFLPIFLANQSPYPKGESNADLGNKLDYLFGKGTGSQHNIERSNAMKAELNKIGIQDTTSGRDYLTEHLNNVLKAPSNISNVKTHTYIAKELPGTPVVEYTTTTRESLLMGPAGALKVEFLWDGNRLLIVILKEEDNKFAKNNSRDKRK